MRMPDIRVITARPHRLLQPLIERIGTRYHSGKPCVLLVPEQFTLQAEKEIIDRLRLKGMFSIEVISPTRLTHRVMEAVGTDERVPLSTAGQQMAVSYALETCAEQLHYYRGSVSRRGFTQKLTALITDMKRGGLQPETLKDYADTLPDGMQKEKFADLAILYGSYQEMLKDRMGDSDDLNEYITKHLGESGLMQHQHVFVYGFDAMAEQLIVLLCAIAAQCDSLTVGLINDSAGASDADIYLPVRQSVARFRKALEENGLGLKEEPLPRESLHSTHAIEHLDQMLFAHPQHPFTGENDSVFLSQFNAPFEEATAATRQIMRLCEQGMKLERIAVLYPDQNGYPFAVSAALTNSGLPYYTDEKLPALSHGLPQFIMAALRAMADNYHSDDVFALMKTGYAPVTFEEACTLEGYAREFGINYGRWLKPFTKGEESVCNSCELLRRKVIQPLIKAREAIISARDTTQSLQAIMNLLTDINAYHTLQTEEEALLVENLLVRAGQNSQMWQTVLDLLDQLFILSDGKRIPLNHIVDRFTCGFAAVSLAALPPAAGMLHTGVLGHYLSGEMDAVFLLGMNDGILARSSESLITEEERAQAQERTRSFLGMTEESRLLFAKLDIKRAMTLPKQRLYLSYAKTDPAGNTLQPLDLVTDMEEGLFESIPDINGHTDELPISAPQAMAALSDMLREYADGDESLLPEIWKKRLAALLLSPATAMPAIQLMRAVGFRVETLPLAQDLAAKLFGDRTLSVSRLEEFAACPFRHYITYGLCPQEQKDWEISPIETGNFFHSSLQSFAMIASQHPQFPHIPKQEIEQMAEEASAPLIQTLKQGPMGDGPRSLAALDQATRVLHRACETVTDHLAAGEFAVDRAEAQFGYPGKDSFPPVMLTLSDGTQITLHGRIDRIDSYHTPEADYRRVVDYKSGPYATLDAAELWQGTQLQLMLYLDAVTQNAGKAKPAGAFYFHLIDPLAKTDSDQPDTVRADIQKQLQMDGITLAEPTVLHAMDSGEEAVSIPAAVTKTGTMRKNAKVLDADHLCALLRHARQKATQFSQQMLDGDIAIRPIRHGQKDSCTYCDYHAICEYDPLARGAQGREIFNMTLEDLALHLDREAGRDTEI